MFNLKIKSITKAKWFKNFKYMLKVMWFYDKGFFIISLLKTFVSGISPIVNIVFPKFIIYILSC